MKNPVGADGWLTKLGERIPGVNDGIQKLHARAGKQEALERARNVNPVGPQGKLTKLGELTPGVNNVIQHLHRRAGQEEAAQRAAERNPIGTQGWITKVGEQVPIVSDGIRALHVRHGKLDAAERASVHSLARMLGKDGMVTRVTEMLPGLNVVAAAVHEVAGNDEEADRALDLLGSWRGVGSPDGALAKFAEFFPGTDVVAFALHLKHGHLPQALRSVTKTMWVQVRSKSILCLVNLASVDAVEVLNYAGSDLKISPKSPSIIGALVDVFVNVLELDRNGHRRSERQRRTRVRSDARQQPEELERSSCSSRSSDSKGKRQRVKRQVDVVIKSAVNEAIRNAIDGQIERLPETFEMSVALTTDVLRRRRAESRLLRALLPAAIPYPSRELVEAIQDGVPFVRGYHKTIGPMEAAFCPEVRQRHVPEIAGGASCLGFAGCCFLGLKTGCLAGCLAGAVSGLAQLRRKATERAAPWLNAQNERAWDDCIVRPSRSSASSSSSAPASSSSTGPARSASGASSGLMASIDGVRARELSKLLRSYLFDQYYAEHWMLEPLKVLERPLVSLASRALVVAGDTVPLAVAIEVPEQIVPDLPYDLWLPEFPLLLELDVDLAPRESGQYIQAARVAIADAVVDKLLDAARRQVLQWDLREADPRFSEFAEPIKLDFEVGLKWPSPVQLSVEVKNFETTLHLPA